MSEASSSVIANVVQTKNSVIANEVNRSFAKPIFWTYESNFELSYLKLDIDENNQLKIIPINPKNWFDETPIHFVRNDMSL